MTTKAIVVEKEIGGRMMRMETGKVAKLASSAVLVTHGETTVMSTVVRAAPRDGIDFFPLTVDYREKLSAGGQVPRRLQEA
jgi:polyribonucleotide nucleotidyltransferase